MYLLLGFSILETFSQLRALSTPICFSSVPYFGVVSYFLPCLVPFVLSFFTSAHPYTCSSSRLAYLLLFPTFNLLSLVALLLNPRSKLCLVLLFILPLFPWSTFSTPLLLVSTFPYSFLLSFPLRVFPCFRWVPVS